MRYGWILFLGIKIIAFQCIACSLFCARGLARFKFGGF